MLFPRLETPLDGAEVGRSRYYYHYYYYSPFQRKPLPQLRQPPFGLT